MNEKEERALWVECAKAAIQSYEIPEDVDNLDDLVDDVADTASLIADAMVEEYEKRYGDSGERERPVRRRTAPARGRGRGEREEPEK